MIRKKDNQSLERIKNFMVGGDQWKVSKEKLEKLNTFDKVAERVGGYIDRIADSPSNNIQNMHKWCVANNCDIETLTPSEREMFRSLCISISANT